ncbi:hypothetical protein FN846DRAFT_885738 [Sphaerosporella brunnea]|uniref:Uncharacterized protein n=1 Tax=Sphaerosporella brunnea TaxID=1250544 RepID=A0A5J5FB39_9PEZI|nr:hypothetical protein FN846DRAFT_885738 [Sphaerosporella brunnea]
MHSGVDLTVAPRGDRRFKNSRSYNDRLIPSESRIAVLPLAPTPQRYVARHCTVLYPAASAAEVGCVAEYALPSILINSRANDGTTNPRCLLERDRTKLFNQYERAMEKYAAHEKMGGANIDTYLLQHASGKPPRGSMKSELTTPSAPKTARPLSATSSRPPLPATSRRPAPYAPSKSLSASSDIYHLMQTCRKVRAILDAQLDSTAVRCRHGLKLVLTRNHAAVRRLLATAALAVDLDFYRYLGHGFVESTQMLNVAIELKDEPMPSCRAADCGCALGVAVVVVGTSPSTHAPISSTSPTYSQPPPPRDMVNPGKHGANHLRTTICGGAAANMTDEVLKAHIATLAREFAKTRPDETTDRRLAFFSNVFAAFEEKGVGVTMIDGKDRGVRMRSPNILQMLPQIRSLYEDLTKCPVLSTLDSELRARKKGMQGLDVLTFPVRMKMYIRTVEGVRDDVSTPPPPPPTTLPTGGAAGS